MTKNVNDSKKNVNDSKKNVNDSKKEKKEKKKREKKTKAIFDISSAVSSDGNTIVADGRLNAVPTSFSPYEHKPLTAEQFIDTPVYLEWKAFVLTTKSNKMRSNAEKLIKRAKTVRKFGDGKTAKKVNRILKLRKTLADLEAECEDIDLEELEGDE